MTLANFLGSRRSFVGYDVRSVHSGVFPALSNFAVLDAANEAAIIIGQIETSDGGSHIIDTSGSSKMEWRTNSSTFANAGTTVKVGFAAVDTTTGPPGRAVNVADVITFDVSRSMIGGGGGIASAAWQSHVPDAGTKTIANGDLVAFAVQMTARAGADSIIVQGSDVGGNPHMPACVSYVGGVYGQQGAAPDAFFTFSDGATGWFNGSQVYNTFGTRTWNSGSATKEYGQLFSFPFPVRVIGFYGGISLSTSAADCDVVLYSNPLGTPVAQRTVAMDATNMIRATADARNFQLMFPSPYDVPPNTPFAAVYKPGAVNVSAGYKTLANAVHRMADPWGTSGYGISRASGAFADANSSLDHYFIGLIVGGFEHGVNPTYGLGV
jgi:hypothetical protein